MSNLNGSITKEMPTSFGSIVTVVRPHGTYEIVRDGTRISAASYKANDGKSSTLKKSVQAHKEEVKKKTEEKKKSMWVNAAKWSEAVKDPSKIISFLKAVKSKAFEGPVSLPVLSHRHQCCFGKTIKGEHVSDPCPAMFEAEGHHYCKSCGCGEWKLARLDVPPELWTSSKLAFPDLTCPLGKWSAVKGGNRA